MHVGMRGDVSNTQPVTESVVSQKCYLLSLAELACAIASVPAKTAASLELGSSSTIAPTQEASKATDTRISDCTIHKSTVIWAGVDERQNKGVLSPDERVTVRETPRFSLLWPFLRRWHHSWAAQECSANSISSPTMSLMSIQGSECIVLLWPHRLR